MKIFVDGYLLNKEYQGTRTYITELYKALARLRPEIEITFGVNEVTTELQNEFKEYSTIQFHVFKQSNKWKRMVSEYIQLSYVFDYMHFQYVTPFLKGNKNCKIINTIHDVLFLDYPEGFPLSFTISRKIFYGWGARNCDILLTVSAYSKSRIAHFFNIKEDSISITPNGVNQLFLEIYDKAEEINFIKTKYRISNYILYVSRIEPRKNQLQLLQLFAQNQEVYNNYNLVLIGKKSLESSEFDQYFNQLDKSIQARVHYIEQVDNTDLIHFYRAASFFVYPTLYEGFGIPPIEAAASKIPVLCNENTSMKDFKFLSPYLIDFKDSSIQNIFNEFITASHDQLDDVKQHVKEHYLWEISAKSLLEALTK